MKRRGFMLVTSLLLGVLLMMLMLALMARDAQREGQAHQFGNSMQALELAEAGLEDARLKLDKDLHLPLRTDPSQSVLNYTDQLTDPQQAAFTVTIDWSRKQLPDETVTVTSTGRYAGATRTLVALLDVATVRNGQPNPFYYRFRQRTDRGSY